MHPGLPKGTSQNRRDPLGFCWIIPMKDGLQTLNVELAHNTYFNWRMWIAYFGIIINTIIIITIVIIIIFINIFIIIIISDEKLNNKQCILMWLCTLFLSHTGKQMHPNWHRLNIDPKLLCRIDVYSMSILAFMLFTVLMLCISIRCVFNAQMCISYTLFLFPYPFWNQGTAHVPFDGISNFYICVFLPHKHAKYTRTMYVVTTAAHWGDVNWMIE